LKETCGNCQRWLPQGSTLEQRLKARFAAPTCTITGKAKYGDEPGCLIHKEASEEQMKERE